MHELHLEFLRGGNEMKDFERYGLRAPALLAFFAALALLLAGAWGKLRLRPAEAQTTEVTGSVPELIQGDAGLSNAPSLEVPGELTFPSLSATPWGSPMTTITGACINIGCSTAGPYPDIRSATAGG